MSTAAKFLKNAGIGGGSEPKKRDSHSQASLQEEEAVRKKARKTKVKPEPEPEPESSSSEQSSEEEESSERPALKRKAPAEGFSAESESSSGEEEEEEETVNTGRRLSKKQALLVVDKSKREQVIAAPATSWFKPVEVLMKQRDMRFREGLDGENGNSLQYVRHRRNKKTGKKEAFQTKWQEHAETTHGSRVFPPDGFKHLLSEAGINRLRAPAKFLLATYAEEAVAGLTTAIMPHVFFQDKRTITAEHVRLGLTDRGINLIAS